MELLSCLEFVQIPATPCNFLAWRCIRLAANKRVMRNRAYLPKARRETREQARILKPREHN